MPALVVFCLLVTGILYFNGLSGGYYFDDIHVLQRNDYLKLEKLDSASLVLAASSFAPGGRELSMLTFALNTYFFGVSTWWMKFVNLWYRSNHSPDFPGHMRAVAGSPDKSQPCAVHQPENDAVVHTIYPAGIDELCLDS
jgi:hypothetical protein